MESLEHHQSCVREIPARYTAGNADGSLLQEIEIRAQGPLEHREKLFTRVPREWNRE